MLDLFMDWERMRRPSELGDAAGKFCCVLWLFSH